MRLQLHLELHILCRTAY